MIARTQNVITEDQTAVLAFLGTPATHGGENVERMDTHASAVFLAGERAYKLKRAVRFDYLDFSTAERRRVMCEAEVRLNRRTAPGLYRGVLAITREADGTLVIGGNGSPVEWVVDMNRFPQEALLDRLASAGRLDVTVMPRLAKAIAAFHACADQRNDHGGQAGMEWVVEGNAAGFEEFGLSRLAPALSQRVTIGSRHVLHEATPLLEHRRLAGFVRQCHGDLHLRNIVLLEGQPVLFDRVEFNDEISCVDVLYDLAFLLMDLWHRRLPRHANAVWNTYLGGTGDMSAISLMPLFLSCRAAVRAKTSATAARVQPDDRRRADVMAASREYLELADRLLHPPPPALVAIGGLSGSGKSTLARGLAPAIGPVPGALVLRSDEIRKRICGVPLLERLGPEGYSPKLSRLVYHTLVEQAAQVLRANHSVIVDAVYAGPEDRGAIEQVAKSAAVPFVGFWLEAPEAALIGRTELRTNDASDADATIVRQQTTSRTGEISWCRIDASVSATSVLDRAETNLGGQCPEAFNASAAEVR